MVFNHKLYGKCTMIPNTKFNVADKMKDVELITYVHLESGEIRDSGITDAGIQTSIIHDEYIFDEQTFVDYGYLNK